MCGCNRATRGQPVRTWTITYPDGREPVQTASQSAVRIAQSRGATVVENTPTPAVGT